MNTHRISPISPLAAKVAEEVRTFWPNTLIAIRGQYFDRGDGDPEEVVYTVSACPDQKSAAGFYWEYVVVREWLAAFDDAQGVENEV